MESPESIRCATPQQDNGLARAKHAHKSEAVGKPNAALPMMVAGFACLVFALGSAASAYDNDMWWILATGREVLQNGIPYTNPFSMHEGMGIVLQQWLACVIAFGLYDSFGMLGIQVLSLVQMLVLTGCLYAVCRVCGRQKTGSGELYLAVIACAFAAFAAYCSVRPHLYSMILFTLVLLVMELYRRDRNRLILVALPILAVVHVNLHAAMAPFDLVIVAVYLVPDIPQMMAAKGISLKSFSFYEADYAKLPVVIALGAMVVALLVNPYGLDGALYTLHSYGSADYGNYINEMGRTGFWTTYGVSAMVMIILGCVALGRNGLCVNMPATLLFVGCIPLSMMHTRNVWLVALFAIPLVAQALGSIGLYREKLKILQSKGVCVVAACGLTVVLGVYAALNVWPEAIEPCEEDSASVPVLACDYLDQQVEAQNRQKSSLKIYNEFNNGGYVEWRGYKAFIDPRPELWEPAITGKEQHYYQTFVDYAQGRVDASYVVKQYDFDYMIVYTNSTMDTYLKGEQSGYHVVEYGDGYRLWAK